MLVVASALAAAYFRYRYGSGDGNHGKTVLWLNIAGLGAALGITVAASNLRYRRREAEHEKHRTARLEAAERHRRAAAEVEIESSTEAGAGSAGDEPQLQGASLTRSLGHVLRRQRLNLLVVVLLTVLLTVVGDTSGQAIDSIRSWSPMPSGGDIDGPSGPARLLMGLSTALLLALAIYESALRLTQQKEGSADPVGVLLVAFGLMALGLGIIVWLAADFGPGLFLAAALVAILLVLELPDLEGNPPSEEPVDLLNADQRVPEWLAIIPLLAYAATSVAATVDAALSGGVTVDTLLIATPVLVLAFLAVLMTSEGDAPRIERKTRPRAWVVMGGAMLLGVLLLLLSSIEGPEWYEKVNWPALFGGASLAVLVLYVIWLFRVPRTAPANGAAARDALTSYAAVLALGAGLSVLVAVHADPIDAGRTLGVLALANVALATFVVFFLYLVLGAMRHRPPRVLWWFGFQQLPVLSLVVIWWVAVGVIGSETLHDVRILDRRPITDAAGEVVTPERSDLAAAFDRWVAAQPELSSAEEGSPVPLVLVASHGGGIRAAYWAASTLDCIVAISAADIELRELYDPSDEERTRTCEGTRRTRSQQQSAARRIFLMSGVSGGAVGLYAYARQLLEEGQLGSATWVDQRLADDFAAPTVAWALFHDVPNRIFGLRPHRGGGCRLSVAGVCWTSDRAAVLEDAFDSAWPGSGTDVLLQHTYDLRSSGEAMKAAEAALVPVFVANATLTGGHTRAVSSAVDLGAWPKRDAAESAAVNADDPQRRTDPLPVAGTIEIADALCAHGDLRFSTAAVLAARFPYVTPSGHVGDGCGRDPPPGTQAKGDCADPLVTQCDGSFVDGGYAENSGLFTITQLWPTLRDKIEQYNGDAAHVRKIAPLIVELDNHYQARLSATVPSGGTTAETVIPLATAFGSRNAMQTYARAAARRLLPAKCMITISPSLHPGLIAPLGWELSPSARDDLRAGRTEPHPEATEEQQASQIKNLRLLQDRLAASDEERLRPVTIAERTDFPELDTCVVE